MLEKDEDNRFYARISANGKAISYEFITISIKIQ